MAAGRTYTPIARQTLSTTVSDVTFSNIPSGYTDLILISNVSNILTSGGTLQCQLNSDTGNNYSWTYLGGNGTTASSGRISGTDRILITDYVVGLSASNPTMAITNFLNYSNTTTYKTVLSRGSGASTEVDASVSLWRSTSAISSIKIYMSGSRVINSGSTFTLYGIAAA